MTTITIELCAEDRARLDKIIDALQHCDHCDTCVQQVVDAFKAPADGQNKPQSEEKGKVEEQAQAPAFIETQAAPPWEEGVPEQPAAPKYSKTDLQKKVVELAAAGKKAAVKEVINRYADRVSLVPEDKVDEAMEQLLKLEG